ncbi:MAG: hypothetical protein JXA44_07200 [Methanospirillaceae archaeon]|nr:hypothetical protein [Methanospirillaceae archaeon]
MFYNEYQNVSLYDIHDISFPGWSFKKPLSTRTTRMEKTKKYGNEKREVIPVQDLLHALVKFYEIRGDLYRYASIPQSRESLKTTFRDNFTILNSLIGQYGNSELTCEEQSELVRLDALLAEYQNRVLKALSLIDEERKEDVFASLIDGNLHDSEIEIDEFLKKLTGVALQDTIPSGSEADIFSANVDTLLTIIEILSAIAIVYPGVFVALGVPATLTKSVALLYEIKKVRPGVELILNRKEEIIIIAGTMTAFADEMQKNAIQTLKQKAAEGKIQNLFVVDDKGNRVPVKSLITYVLNNRQNRKGEQIEEEENESISRETEESGFSREMLLLITRMFDSVRSPFSDSQTASNQAESDKIRAKNESIATEREDMFRFWENLNHFRNRIGTDISNTIQGISNRIPSQRPASENKKAGEKKTK